MTSRSVGVLVVLIDHQSIARFAFDGNVEVIVLVHLILNPSVEVPHAVPLQTFIHASLPLLSTPRTIRLLFGSPATTVHTA